jgi:hypothetical protein
MPRLHDLAPDFRLVELPPGPPLSAAVESRVAAVWAEATRRDPALFNGRVYSLVEHTPQRLAVRASDYCHLMAWRRAPELTGQGLSLRPIGVTGLLVARDGVVFGRRAGHLAADAGAWETAPAGGLDRLDPAGLLLEEMREELGLDSTAASVPRALALIEDETGVFDIVLRLETALGRDALLAAHRDAASDEYAAIDVVAPDDLAAFLAAPGRQVLPIVAPILRRAGLLAA